MKIGGKTSINDNALARIAVKILFEERKKIGVNSRKMLLKKILNQIQDDKLDILIDINC